MPDQILIGQFAKGFTTNPLPFNIDNDAFPLMVNFYTWRQRAKRKRGTVFLGQLQIQAQSVATLAPPLPWQLFQIGVLGPSGHQIGNLTSTFGFPASTTYVPGSFILSDGVNTYRDLNLDGTLQGVPAGSGTINYATGAWVINGGNPHGVLVGFFSYYPGLPVMGLRDLNLSGMLYPNLVAFDTTNAYQITNTSMPTFYNVSFYKGTNNPVTWSGQDYQQFWTTNYSGAFWATNDKPGFHFVNGTYTSGSGTPNITFNFKSGGVNYTTLVIGDQLWFNEWSAGGVTINGLMGTVSNVAGAAAGNYIVTFTGNQTVSGTGIAQLLTNSIAGQDGIKWYDGDPTGGTGLPTGTGLGWVNFAPPLTALNVSIDNSPLGLYYLVGALAILPYKDRLLFFAPFIQTSTGSPILLQDTVIWSWNGTPYYTTPVPAGQTSNIKAYYVDQTGLGGWLAAGIEQPLVTVTNNEDVLLVGFSQRQTRFVYTGNDLSPFLFFSINSELGSSATFSGITLDRGGVTIGRRGITLTTQQSTGRIDLEIPETVFQVKAQNNGVQRVNAVRDFFKEWIYFCYPVNDSPWKYPTQTLLWNYRDDTWAIFYENFTAQGTYRQTLKNTWASIGQKFKTWAQWRESWNSGSTSPLFPSVVGGTPQGYVLIKGQGTGESVSGTILGISNPGSLPGNTQINSINHCVSEDNPLLGIGDYLYFQGAITNTSTTITGITNANPAVITTTNTFTAGQYVFISQVVGMTQINGRYLQIISATSSSITVNIDSTLFTAYASGGLATFSPLQNQIGQVISIIDANNFVVDIPFSLGSSTYTGKGQFVRLSQPLIQTKQFPFYWQEGRQVRLLAQKYLMDTTASGQITVNIYLSQDPDDPWNNPIDDAPLNSLIYSQVLFTCPESPEGIGVTPANTNLQMPTASSQYQIWHRMNTSLIGDTFQIGLTLSDSQMRNYQFATSEITLHGMALTVERGPQLA